MANCDVYRTAYYGIYILEYHGEYYIQSIHGAEICVGKTFPTELQIDAFVESLKNVGNE